MYLVPLCNLCGQAINFPIVTPAPGIVAKICEMCGQQYDKLIIDEPIVVFHPFYAQIVSSYYLRELIVKMTGFIFADTVLSLGIAIWIVGGAIGLYRRLC